MQLRQWVGMGMLAGGLAVSSLAWSTSSAPAPDIPTMAQEFAKSMALHGAVVCTATPLPGYDVWACTAALEPGVTMTPTGFLCHADAGCWAPVGPLPPPALIVKQ